MANDPASAEHGQDRAGSIGEAPDKFVAEPAAAPTAPPNLTQELAHLLAASIAQTHAARTGGSAAPTGADLASLAQLMANAQSARQPLPPYRDELSSLNYPRPLAPQSGPASHREAGYAPQGGAPRGLDAVHHDDEPMPIPSTWREPAMHDDERPFLKQLGAAALGLAAGLVLIVPAVLWLTGTVGPQRGKLGSDVAQSRAGEVRTVRTRPMESATFNPNEVMSSPPSAPEVQPLSAASMTKAPAVDASQQIETLLVQARQRIETGDVQGARELLSGDGSPSAPLLFALAETYDPNMLAAWGSRGVSADVQRARALYAKALDLGFGRAMARLDALR